MLTCWIVDFAFPANHREKIKENEEKGKYLDLAKELKKLWNMKIVIPIGIGALETIPKGLVKRLEEFEDGQKPSKLQHCSDRSSEDLKRLMPPRLQWKTIN